MSSDCRLLDVPQPDEHRHRRHRFHQSGNLPGEILLHRKAAYRPERDQPVAGRRHLHFRVLQKTLRRSRQVSLSSDQWKVRLKIKAG